MSKGLSFMDSNSKQWIQLAASRGACAPGHEWFLLNSDLTLEEVIVKYINSDIDRVWTPWIICFMKDVTPIALIELLIKDLAKKDYKMLAAMAQRTDLFSSINEIYKEIV
tara:strand:- start:2713 stop:3042 length:330 start_codon:yes stop_codon:yes gene_type:complete